MACVRGTPERVLEAARARAPHPHFPLGVAGRDTVARWSYPEGHLAHVPAQDVGWALPRRVESLPQEAPPLGRVKPFAARVDVPIREAVGLPVAKRPLGAAVERAHADEGGLLSLPAPAVEGDRQQSPIEKKGDCGVGELPGLEKLRARERPDVNGGRRSLLARHEALRVGRESDGIFGSRRQLAALAAVPFEQEQTCRPAERQPPPVGAPLDKLR